MLCPPRQRIGRRRGKEYSKGEQQSCPEEDAQAAEVTEDALAAASTPLGFPLAPKSLRGGSLRQGIDLAAPLPICHAELKIL